MKLINLIKNSFLSSGIKNDSQPPEDYFRLKREFKRIKFKRLHFGCGPRILKNWINIDLSYEPYENYLKYYTDKFYPPPIRGSRKDLYALNITKYGLPLPDNSVDVVFHEDFIEHLDQKEQIIFLAETLRVLKKGGVHRINTPDLKESMRAHSDFSKGFAGVYQQEWDKHVHKNILTAHMLEILAKMVGYKKIIHQKRNKSLAKGLPLEYRPDPKDRPEVGNLYLDIIK